MTFYKELYCDETTSKSKKKIIRKIRRNAGQLGVYVIALSNGNDLFDIFHVGNLKQKYFPKESLHIIGIASSYEAALKLVQDMIQNFYEMYGTYDFKGKILEDDKEWY